jgi:hypothetical protein
MFSTRIVQALLAPEQAEITNLQNQQAQIEQLESTVRGESSRING